MTGRGWVVGGGMSEFFLFAAETLPGGPHRFREDKYTQPKNNNNTPPTNYGLAKRNRIKLWAGSPSAKLARNANALCNPTNRKKNVVIQLIEF